MKLLLTVSYAALGSGYVLNLPRAIGDTCSGPEGAGSCISTGECLGISYPQSLCPNDPDDIQCCVKIECTVPAGKGFCRSVSNNGCDSGEFHAGTSAPWPCPGDSDIQCCVKGGSTPPPSQPPPSGGDACTVSAGSGTCMSKSGGGCTGTFHPGAGPPWPCPSSDDIQCCVTSPAPPGSGNPGGAGRIDDETRAHLKVSEGFRKNFYDDGTGHRTIGYGHNCDALGCNDLSEPLSEAVGNGLLTQDLVQFENCVCGLPNAAGLNKKQFGALVSFAYNSGCGGVKRDFRSTMEASDFAGVCSKFPGTNTLGGLLNSRRRRESELCSTPTNAPSGC